MKTLCVWDYSFCFTAYDVILLLFCFLLSSQVILDVQQFSPNEITVKTVDNYIIVEAKHEEKKDEHGFISRSFVRRYVLPSTHDLNNITSSLSSDGVLTISAPKKVNTGLVV